MALMRRLTNLCRRSRLDRDIDDELQSHIDLATEEKMRQGLPHAVAHREALLRFGNPASTRERVTSADATLGLESIVPDLRLAFRQLLRAPGFAITAVLTLSVAICANAVVFSVMNALVLRPLNLPDATRLYTIENRDQPPNSYPDYLDLRSRNRTFDDIALYNFGAVGLDTGGDPQQIWIYEASGNYFNVLGAQPYLGRFFQSSDEHGPNSVPYVVLSYAYWRDHFHADPAAIGRTVQLNRHAFTILGVAQPQFRGTELIYSPALWAPIVDQKQIEGVDSLQDRTNRNLWLVARLKPHLTIAQGESDLNRIGQDLIKIYPVDDDGLHFTLARPGLVGNMLGGPVRAFLTGLILLAGMILLAACANLGSLFAARAADRSREIALRIALGSTRKRILRQLFTEALLVSLSGGVLGIFFSIFLLRALSAWQPVPKFPLSMPVNPDLTTYAIALALALVSGFLFGLAPVKQILGAAPWEIVRTGAKATEPRRRFTTRDVLLVIQIAACAILMTSSLVAVRGLARSLHSSFGFHPENAVLLETDLNMAGYTGDRIPAMQHRMIDTAAAIPGVAAAGTIDNIPLGLGWSETSAYTDQTTDFRLANQAADTMQYAVSPDYFTAAGTSLLAGRSFSWLDDKNAPAIAIVNEEFARKVFGSVPRAIGAHFRINAKSRFLVVGVVEDGKYMSLTEDLRPAFFQPVLQTSPPISSMWMVVRTRAEPQRTAGVIRETMRNLDPSLPLTFLTWDEQLNSALFAARAATIALGVLGSLGALLAITGIFGMASYSVGRRLKEMGIRVALGAGHGQVLTAALGRPFRLLAAGSVAGLVLGLAATRLLSYIVYQASPRDPIVLAGTVAVMLVVGLVATWLPAQRALNVDPSKLMREE